MITISRARDRHHERHRKQEVWLTFRPREVGGPEPGQHVVHALSEGRIAWLHLVQGEARLGDVVLTTGDGAGLTGERAVSLTAQSETEILLLDLSEPPPRLPGNGGAG